MSLQIRRGGFETRPVAPVARQSGRGEPRPYTASANRPRNQRPNPTSLIFAICYLLTEPTSLIFDNC
ncbi:MAG: hypothetical protein LBM98_03245 [Oscillospiraceae bacterium]|nr:hypothetical protein [Oscillospiraceae bacterium]